MSFSISQNQIEWLQSYNASELVRWLIEGAMNAEDNKFDVKCEQIRRLEKRIRFLKQRIADNFPVTEGLLEELKEKRKKLIQSLGELAER
mgnify:CR=1 FL=1